MGGGAFAISFLAERIVREPGNYVWDSRRLNLRATYGLVDALGVWGMLGKNQVVQTYPGKAGVSLLDHYRNSYGFGFSTVLYRLNRPDISLYLSYEQMRLSAMGQIDYPTPLGEVNGTLISREDYQWWELHPQLGLAITMGDYTIRAGVDGFALVESRYVDQKVIVGADTAAVGHRLIRSSETLTPAWFLGIDRKFSNFYWARLEFRYAGRFSFGAGISQATPNYIRPKATLKDAWPQIASTGDPKRPFLVLVPTNHGFDHGQLYVGLSSYAWRGYLGYPSSMRARLSVGLFNIARLGTSVRSGYYPATNIAFRIVEEGKLFHFVKLPYDIPVISLGIEGRSYGPPPEDRFKLLNGQKLYLAASGNMGEVTGATYLQNTEVVVGYGREIQWHERYPRLQGLFWGIKNRYNVAGVGDFIYTLEFDGHDFNFDLTHQLSWGARLRLGLLSIMRQPQGKPQWYIGLDSTFDSSPLKSAFGFD
jgi:hypothetical protein